jgi:heptosyltransferase-2
MQLNEKSKILIIRFSSFGDVLLTSGILRVIKEKHPFSELHFLVKKPFSQMIEHNKNIDVLHFYENHEQAKNELKNISFDFVGDLQANQRTFRLRKSLNFKKLGIYKKDRIKRFLYVKFGVYIFNKEVLSIPERYALALEGLNSKNEQFFPEYSIFPEVNESIFSIKEPYIVVAPGAAHFTKQWPKEYYLELIKNLNKNYKIVLVGGENESETAHFIAKNTEIYKNFVGKISFNETAYLIKNSKILICNDSSVMHLAAALNKKIITFFGSTTEVFGFYPYRTKSVVLEKKNLNCRPCTHMGKSKCPKKHFKCMKDILPEEALKNAEKLLEEK